MHETTADEFAQRDGYCVTVAEVACVVGDRSCDSSKESWAVCSAITMCSTAAAITSGSERVTPLPPFETELARLGSLDVQAALRVDRELRDHRLLRRLPLQARSELSLAISA